MSGLIWIQSVWHSDSILILGNIKKKKKKKSADKKAYKITQQAKS